MTSLSYYDIRPIFKGYYYDTTTPQPQVTTNFTLNLHAPQLSTPTYLSVRIVSMRGGVAAGSFRSSLRNLAAPFAPNRTIDHRPARYCWVHLNLPARSNISSGVFWYRYFCIGVGSKNIHYLLQSSSHRQTIMGNLCSKGTPVVQDRDRPQAPVAPKSKIENTRATFDPDPDCAQRGEKHQ